MDLAHAVYSVLIANKTRKKSVNNRHSSSLTVEAPEKTARTVASCQRQSFDVDRVVVKKPAAEVER